MIASQLKKKIKKYCLENNSIEACGVVVGGSDGTEFLPCKNIHPCPEAAFAFSPKHIIREDLKYIFHSHPKTCSRASEIDKKYSNELGVPFLIYSLPADDFSLYLPKRVYKYSGIR
jgi:proteasome lid subunit RPN8/RPN11